MKFIKNGNWGLRLLALILAILTYHALKKGPATRYTAAVENDGRSIFQHH
ncbi:MAG: hypothetical protein J6T01_04680 [Kiritimatiellae bacterium]|nr:hypothetical protein [Kiritimatiellia bacterium]